MVSLRVSETLWLDSELLAGELEAVEVADNRRGDAVGREEFAGDLLDLLGGHASSMTISSSA